MEANVFPSCPAVCRFLFKHTDRLTGLSGSVLPLHDAINWNEKRPQHRVYLVVVKQRPPTLSVSQSV